MKRFEGFPSVARFTSIPDPFFSSLLPQIDDINELKVTLFIFRALYAKRGYPRFVTHGELLGIKSLVDSLHDETEPISQTLGSALGAAANRGTIIELSVDKGGTPELYYFLNTAGNRKAIDRIKSGELSPGEYKIKEPVEPASPQAIPDIFKLYEDNIGMLTPLIADELKQAEEDYPAPWIRDAIKEAVDNNKRSWRYIGAILERWSSEGKNSGAYRRDNKKTDPDKYIKGKYGHMVRR